MRDTKLAFLVLLALSLNVMGFRFTEVLLILSCLWYRLGWIGMVGKNSPWKMRALWWPNCSGWGALQSIFRIRIGSYLGMATYLTKDKHYAWTRCGEREREKCQRERERHREGERKQQKKTWRCNWGAKLVQLLKSLFHVFWRCLEPWSCWAVFFHIFPIIFKSKWQT